MLSNLIIGTLFFGMMCISHISLAHSNPIELGTVNWIRNLEEGQVIAKQKDKPILLLFQEVPGCGTCKQYGSSALSHPLIVEAIEEYFVPVAIYNNKNGHDAEVLKYFGEPSWNNPVVRIVDHNRKNITKRLSGNNSTVGLIQTLMTGLSQTGQKIPTYLNLLAQEYSTRNTESATYSMYCFWSGEAHFGQRDGILSTEAGHASGREVVKVEYDPSVISKKELDKYANKASCHPIEKVKNYHIDGEPKYYLSHSVYRYIPMTSLQKSRVNSALKNRHNPNDYLSLQQINLKADIESGAVKSKKNVVLVPLEEAWNDYFGQNS